MLESTTSDAAKSLRDLVTRIETLEEGKSQIAEDIKGVYADAKAMGFDTKTLRTCIKLRKMDKNERLEAEELLTLYQRALGMLPTEDDS